MNITLLKHLREFQRNVLQKIKKKKIIEKHFHVQSNMCNNNQIIKQTVYISFLNINLYSLSGRSNCNCAVCFLLGVLNAWQAEERRPSLFLC